ncbi:hypothetical protein TPMD04_33 [Thiohalocapsa phage LS06-2018-MD04]|jgi:hypothetical protein|nr:hypothetical protein TPMD04_33 [Thiohalocapsa phage LS06-2018-MD04]
MLIQAHPERPGVWPAVEPYLSRALEKAQVPEWTLSQVYDNVVSGRWALYALIENQCVIGAGVVAVSDYGLRRVLEVVMFGADEHTRAWEDMLDSLKRIAKSLKCAAIRCEGRPGWERVLKMRRINLFELEV